MEAPIGGAPADPRRARGCGWGDRPHETRSGRRGDAVHRARRGARTGRGHRARGLADRRGVVADRRGRAGPDRGARPGDRGGARPRRREDTAVRGSDLRDQRGRHGGDRDAHRRLPADRRGGRAVSERRARPDPRPPDPQGTGGPRVPRLARGREPRRGRPRSSRTRRRPGLAGRVAADHDVRRHDPGDPGPRARASPPAAPSWCTPAPPRPRRRFGSSRDRAGSASSGSARRGRWCWTCSIATCCARSVAGSRSAAARCWTSRRPCARPILGTSGSWPGGPSADRTELPALLVDERGAVRADDIAVLTGGTPPPGAARLVRLGDRPRRGRGRRRDVPERVPPRPPVGRGGDARERPRRRPAGGAVDGCPTAPRGGRRPRGAARGRRAPRTIRVDGPAAHARGAARASRRRRRASWSPPSPDRTRRSRRR